MKSAFLLIISFILLGISFSDVRPLTGRWKVDFIVLNEDTIFKQLSFAHTLAYNYKLNSPVETLEDSARIQKLAKNNFMNSSAIHIDFQGNRSFKMTKVRSGGKSDTTALDKGIYTLSGDSLILINKSRNNQHVLFFYNKEEDYFFMKNNQETQKIYIQYKRAEKY